MRWRFVIEWPDLQVQGGRAMRHIGRVGQLSIYRIPVDLLGQLCFGLAAVLVVYCFFYAMRSEWLVAIGGAVIVAALLLLAATSRRYGHHMPGRITWLAILGINLGAAIAMIALGPLGIVWYAPLVFVNLLFVGLFSGSVVSGLAIALIVYLGEPDVGAEFVINIVGALLLSLLIGYAYRKSQMSRESALRQHAERDALTGAINRRGLDELLADLFRSGSTGLCALMLDLDHFKRINDELGHHAGDAVLAEFARVIRENLRRDDRFARYGGEEFVVLLQADLASARNVAEKLREAIESHEFPDKVRLTASIGLAVGQPDETGAQLVRRADAALYRAKREGRNRCCFPDGE